MAVKRELVIDFLRFPLTLLVVFIHVHYISWGNKLCDNIHEFWINGICSIAVPAFFFISGYLFFTSPQKFSFDVYLSKLKRRINTLLVPYLLWNLIALIVIIIPHFHNFDFTVNNIIAVFVDCRYSFLHTENSSPIDYPLWYIRDLMVCCILSPLFYVTKKVKFLIPLFFGVLWVIGIQLPVGMSSIAICFFTLGGIIRIYNIPLKNKAVMWLAVSLFCILIYILTGMNKIFYKVVTPIIVLSLLPVGERFLSHKICVRCYNLGTLSFVIYAMHAIIIKRIFNVLMELNLCQGEIYLLTYIITILLCLAFDYIVRTTMPIVYNALTGRRIK